jgi:hypothetical protein
VLLLEDTTEDSVGLALEVIGDAYVGPFGKFWVQEEIRSFGNIIVDNNLLLDVGTRQDSECTSDMEGAIFYHSTLNELCYCDGSAHWLQVDGGGSC